MGLTRITQKWHQTLATLIKRGQRIGDEDTRKQACWFVVDLLRGRRTSGEVHGQQQSTFVVDWRGWRARGPWQGPLATTGDACGELERRIRGGIEGPAPRTLDSTSWRLWWIGWAERPAARTLHNNIWRFLHNNSWRLWWIGGPEGPTMRTLGSGNWLLWWIGRVVEGPKVIYWAAAVDVFGGLEGLKDSWRGPRTATIDIRSIWEEGLKDMQWGPMVGACVWCGKLRVLLGKDQPIEEPSLFNSYWTTILNLA